MRFRSALLYLSLIFFVFSHQVGWSAEANVKLTGIFSSLEYVPEAGDLTGMELFIIPSNTGRTVFFQNAEGGLPEAISCDATLIGRSISFDLPRGFDTPEATDHWHFSGEIRSKELVADMTLINDKRDGPTNHVVLKRQKSYWQ